MSSSENEEDVAEEYFRMVERLDSSPRMMKHIEAAREAYKKRTRYTEQYFDEREASLARSREKRSKNRIAYYWHKAKEWIKK